MLKGNQQKIPIKRMLPKYKCVTKVNHHPKWKKACTHKKACTITGEWNLQIHKKICAQKHYPWYPPIENNQKPTLMNSMPWKVLLCFNHIRHNGAINHAVLLSLSTLSLPSPDKVANHQDLPVSRIPNKKCYLYGCPAPSIKYPSTKTPTLSLPP